ncbi:hypothetical protein [Microvirga sesbaniae]|uniref:hypothetical protein n=1 Tax=Microvirga sesbaniae TaxID=681392 RepID=UPI0021C58313|nr:hypothetical protein [Microvirga sp. HBU67692]
MTNKTLIVGTGVSMAALSLAGGLMAGSFVPPNTWFVMVALQPAIEETARYMSARKFVWEADLKTAACIGGLIGLLEIGSKALMSQMIFKLDFATLLSLIGFSPSLPIHIALSVAFYSFRRWRPAKTFGMHALLNLTLLAFAVSLWGSMSIPAYAATMVVFSVALCFTLTVVVRRIAST